MPSDSGHITLAEAVDLFVEDLTIRKVSPRTVKAYRTDLRVIAELLGSHDGPWTVAELSPPVLHKVFAAHAATHAPASVARARSTWSALFDLLVRNGTLTGSPIAAVPTPVSRPGSPSHWPDGTPTPSPGSCSSSWATVEPEGRCGPSSIEWWCVSCWAPGCGPASCST